MTDVRFTCAEDGCCTLFVGRMLVFSDLTETEARDLAQALGGTPIERSAPAAPVTPEERSVGGRAGRTLPRSRTCAPEQTLAYLR